MSLTVLYLGAELALFGILKNRVVAGVCALHSTVAAGLVKEGTIATWGRAATQGHLLKPTCADTSLQSPGAQEQLDVGESRLLKRTTGCRSGSAHVSHPTLRCGPQTQSQAWPIEQALIYGPGEHSGTQLWKPGRAGSSGNRDSTDLI